MTNKLVKILVGVFHGVAFICDLVIYLPWYLIDPPTKRLAESKRVKARPVREGDPSAPYRAVEAIEAGQLLSTPFPDCLTIDEAFRRTVRLHGEKPCLGTRLVLEEEDEVQPNGKVFKKDILGDYEWLTYEDADARIERISKGLQTLGLASKSSVVCIYAETRAEWMISALACMRFNCPVMTLYSTLGDEAIVHGVNETKASVIITTAENLSKFKKLVERLPTVRHLIYMTPRIPSSPSIDHFPPTINVHSLLSVENSGAKSVSHAEEINGKISKPGNSDLAVIMYTSGSTGFPKGVLISHRNLLSAMAGQALRVKDIGTEDVYIGYLPLAHVLELSAELACICYGASIGYSSPNTLSDQSTRIKRGCKGDATILRPTLMATVPVIMDRILKGIRGKMSKGGAFQQALFQFAYEYKLWHYKAGFDTPLLNRLIFNKIREMLGGRIRLVLCGGAALSADSQVFIRTCFGCPIGQGYGLTETCGAGTIQEDSDRSSGRVGAPLQCNDIKLIDWPEGSYTTKDKPHPRGEVWIGGENVALGYYLNPEKTAEDFHVDADGKRWFATGDIGEFHEDGCLKIIDRKKDLVKLSGGEYVALGSVETVLKLCPLVDNVCVVADVAYMFVVCLVVPNQQNVLNLVKNIEGCDTSVGWKNLCDNEIVINAVLKAIQQYAAKEKLPRIEIPQAVKLCSEVWTADSGLITDTYKIKRRAIEDHFKTDIQRLFKSADK